MNVSGDGTAYYRGETKDPDLRFTTDGLAMVSFGLKFYQGKGKPDGWISVTAFGDLAERVAESVRHGDRVTVVGRLTHRQDGEAAKRDYFSVVAYDVGLSLKFDAAQSIRVPKSGPPEVPGPSDAPF